ncbi:helix-turn-helix domain-containing protein [Algoriphagus vanfongensis]|uniref:helix-turn-helix domain-containing protein n=1 Tax=Algoriphagus vanfongensis TaxID=426371 RepID=UPI00047B4ED9|nr:helix-turn-helix transcriptional regulator [Algoriphagus vanfongensis]
MEKHDERIIRGKISLFLSSKIETENEIKKQLEKKGKTIPTGLNFEYKELAYNSEVRKATISDIIQCKTSAKLSTILKCLEALDIPFPKFAKEFDEISNEKAIEQYLKLRG